MIYPALMPQLRDAFCALGLCLRDIFCRVVNMLDEALDMKIRNREKRIGQAGLKYAQFLIILFRIMLAQLYRAGFSQSAALFQLRVRSEFWPTFLSRRHGDFQLTSLSNASSYYNARNTVENIFVVRSLSWGNYSKVPPFALRSCPIPSPFLSLAPSVPHCSSPFQIHLHLEGLGSHVVQGGPPTADAFWSLRAHILATIYQGRSQKFVLGRYKISFA